jgi:UDP-N-acetylmuramoyl-L-alanyl-D-glutamate--2,6-diaminopimelate ligase
MISSVGAEINGKKYPLPFHVTTPPPFALQKFIKKAKGAETKNYLVLEVTSHSLDQFRVFGINFEVGVITNVTPEHLD